MVLTERGAIVLWHATTQWFGNKAAPSWGGKSVGGDPDGRACSEDHSYVARSLASSCTTTAMGRSRFA